MSDDLVRRFRLLQEALNHGCSDGGCVIEVTKGQHTNGGCKCLYHPEQYTLNRVGHMLRCAQDMADRIEELEAERDDYAFKLAQANNTYSEMHVAMSEANDKLAKAVEALDEAWFMLTVPHLNYEPEPEEPGLRRIKTTIAELKADQ